MNFPVDVESDAFHAELEAVMQRAEGAAKRRQFSVVSYGSVSRENTCAEGELSSSMPSVQSSTPGYCRPDQQDAQPAWRTGQGQPEHGVGYPWRDHPHQQDHHQQEWLLHRPAVQNQAPRQSLQLADSRLQQSPSQPQVLPGSQMQRLMKTNGSSPSQNYKVTVYFTLAGRLEAFMTPYAERLVGHFKAVGGYQDVHKSEHWSFPVGRLQELEARLKKDNVMVESLPPIVRRAIEQLSNCADDSALYDSLPVALEQKLFPFQREGVKYILKRGGRGLIGDEMGLGKTLQAIALLRCYERELPALILVPASLRLQWSHELQQSLGVPASDIRVVWNSQEADLGGCYNIVSYDFVPKLENEIRAKNFQVVIADESHYLKNFKAQRSKSSVPVLQRARRAILLTGTPVLSRNAELFQQLSGLHKACFSNFNAFAERYCAGGSFGFAMGSSNLPELHALLETFIMVRRRKKDVLTQLPAKQRQKVLLQVLPKELEPCTKLLAQMRVVEDAITAARDSSEKTLLQNQHDQLVIALYIATADAKKRAVQAYMEDLVESNTKFLVFGHHKGLLDAVEVTLAKLQQKFIRIDGETKTTDRQGLVDQFQTNKSTRAAILGITAAGVGLNLTAASTVVFAEYAWNPGNILQAEDRAHRIGQEGSVNIYFLHVNGTGDDLMWNRLQSKLANVAGALDGSFDDTYLKLEQTTQAPPRQLAGQTTLDNWKQPLVVRNTPRSSPLGNNGPLPADAQPENAGAVAGAKRRLSLGDEGKGSGGPMDKFLHCGPSQ